MSAPLPKRTKRSRRASIGPNLHEALEEADGKQKEYSGLDGRFLSLLMSLLLITLAFLHAFPHAPSDPIYNPTTVVVDLVGSDATPLYSLLKGQKLSDINITRIVDGFLGEAYTPKKASNGPLSVFIWELKKENPLVSVKVMGGFHHSCNPHSDKFHNLPIESWQNFHGAKATWWDCALDLLPYSEGRKRWNAEAAPTAIEDLVARASVACEEVFNTEMGGYRVVPKISNNSNGGKFLEIDVDKWTDKNAFFGMCLPRDEARVWIKGVFRGDEVSVNGRTPLAFFIVSLPEGHWDLCGSSVPTPKGPQFVMNWCLLYSKRKKQAPRSKRTSYSTEFFTEEQELSERLDAMQAPLPDEEEDATEEREAREEPPEIDGLDDLFALDDEE